jgi:hypothetical protein
MLMGGTGTDFLRLVAFLLFFSTTLTPSRSGIVTGPLVAAEPERLAAGFQRYPSTIRAGKLLRI